jgi:hypothetical protein
MPTSSAPPPSPLHTATDPGSQLWAANREAVTGLRVWGTNWEHHFPPGFDRLWVGSDPTGPDVREGYVIRVVHPKVSRRHATIEWRGPNLVVVDQGSKNGTFADGRPQAVFELLPGSVVEFGEGVRLIAFNQRTQIVRGVLRRFLGYGDAMQPLIEDLQSAAMQREPFAFVGPPRCGGITLSRALHMALPANAWPFVEPIQLPADRAGQRDVVASAAYGTLAINTHRRALISFEKLRHAYEAITSNAYHVRLSVLANPAYRVEYMIGAELRSRTKIIDMPPLGSRLGELQLLLEDTIGHNAKRTGAALNVLHAEDGADLAARIEGNPKRGRRKIEDWDDLDEYVPRLIALRQGGGLNQAEKILGMAHGMMSKWASKWSPPSDRG